MEKPPTRLEIYDGDLYLHIAHVEKAFCLFSRVFEKTDSEALEAALLVSLELGNIPIYVDDCLYYTKEQLKENKDGRKNKTP